MIPLNREEGYINYSIHVYIYTNILLHVQLVCYAYVYCTVTNFLCITNLINKKTLVLVHLASWL